MPVVRRILHTTLRLEPRRLGQYCPTVSTSVPHTEFVIKRRHGPMWGLTVTFGIAADVVMPYTDGEMHPSSCVVGPLPFPTPECNNNISGSS
jgi:hypothetical protein